ncbi:MAG: drug/metabolite exporter YedA [Gemmatimonadota bacterium]|nr:drug/metabolite exporter YedA [Gemmatimonadota bacterium]
MTSSHSVDAAAPAAPSRAALMTAFALVYVIWGSTYLFIRYAVETIPPFFMAGARYLIAGIAVYAWTRLRGGPRAPFRQWRAAAIVGALLLMGGNGAVTWSEQRVASGIAALLVAIVPLWMVLLDWWRPGGTRPNAGTAIGLAIGLAGMALLVGPGVLHGGGGIDPVGAAVLIVGGLSWALGSLYARTADLPNEPMLANGMEMMAGGAILLLAGLLTGESHRLVLSAVSAKSMWSLIYLITIGAIVGFSAYTYLIRNAAPSLVGTYAYVNPVVAILLGWAFAGEPLTLRMVAAGGVIVAGVALITLSRRS